MLKQWLLLISNGYEYKTDGIFETARNDVDMYVWL